MIRLAIADDHPYFRIGLKSVIAQDADLEVVLECSSGEDLLSIPQLSNKVDVIILDVKTSGMEGWDVCRTITQRYPSIRVLVMSMYESETVIHKMAASGATAYLLKDVAPNEMLSAVHSIHSNGHYFNTHLNLDKLRKYVMHPHTGNEEGIHTDGYSKKVELTAREKEILAYLCDQYTDIEIAQKVHLSQSTVHGYRIRLLEKIGAKNVVGLVLYALKHNMLIRPIASTQVLVKGTE